MPLCMGSHSYDCLMVESHYHIEVKLVDDAPKGQIIKIRLGPEPRFPVH